MILRQEIKRSVATVEWPVAFKAKSIRSNSFFLDKLSLEVTNGFCPAAHTRSADLNYNQRVYWTSSYVGNLYLPSLVQYEEENSVPVNPTETSINAKVLVESICSTTVQCIATINEYNFAKFRMAGKGIHTVRVILILVD